MIWTTTKRRKDIVKVRLMGHPLALLNELEHTVAVVGLKTKASRSDMLLVCAYGLRREELDSLEGKELKDRLAEIEEWAKKESAKWPGKGEEREI